VAGEYSYDVPAGGVVSFMVARYQGNGSLDPSFGSGGIAAQPSPFLSVVPSSLRLQSDGKIVVVGLRDYNPGDTDFVLLRLNGSDGSPDSTFGAGGWVRTDLAAPGAITDDQASAVAIGSDGKIVVAGFSNVKGTYGFALARYLPSEPEIGSFTANPNPVTSGSSLTLSASNITDGNTGSTITQVAFYVVINGTSTLLGYGTQTSPGVWTFTFTVNLAPGTYTLTAQAEDSYGVFGDPFATALTVQ
jgi:uncharacterized delta-60 repeat protein